MKKILAISGSTRKNSTNHQLIRALAGITKDVFDFNIYKGIELLPHFNPDETDKAPGVVAQLREQVAAADGVIICTPEYAHGVPGSLKNAIDWLVSSNELNQKPTALITASTDGSNAHQSLLETLRVLEAKDVEQNHLLISFAATKISNEKIVDHHTLEQINRLLTGLKMSVGS